MSSALCAVTFRCTHAAKLASFWAEVLERPVDDGASDEFAAIGLQDPPGRRPHWMFLKVPQGKAARNRVHCDLIAAGSARRGEAPCQRRRHQALRARGGRSQVGQLLDPEGNEFDAVADPA
jgi:hypothetical protein